MNACYHLKWIYSADEDGKSIVTGNKETNYWWPAIIYPNYQELINDTSDNIVKAKILLESFKSTGKMMADSTHVAFFLGEKCSSLTKTVDLKNDHQARNFFNYFYTYSLGGNMSKNLCFKSAVADAIVRIKEDVEKCSLSPILQNETTKSKVKLTHKKETSRKHIGMGEQNIKQLSTGVNLVTGTAEKSRKPQKLFVDELRVGKYESWNHVWEEMRENGWEWVRGKGLVSYYYIFPGGENPVKNRCAVEKIDYFTSEDDVKIYAREHYNWIGEKKSDQYKVSADRKRSNRGKFQHARTRRKLEFRS